MPTAELSKFNVIGNKYTM